MSSAKDLISAEILNTGDNILHSEMYKLIPSKFILYWSEK